MPSLNKFTLFLFGLALTLTVSACGKEENSDRHNAFFSQYIGKNISELTVLTLDGEQQKFSELPALYGDKPIVLNVWATWCPPCLKELPSLDNLAKEGTYTVITLATDKTAGTVQAYLQRQAWGAHLKTLHDPAGRASYGAIGARALPVTYILDKSLAIKGIEAGERNWNSRDMIQKIAHYLK